MKTCKGCGVSKAVEEFYKYPAGYIYGKCKICIRQKSYIRWNTDREQHKKTLRSNYLMRKYGLTDTQYEAMLEAQGGRCAICGADKPSGTGRWHIDHNHSCCPGLSSCGSCIRGLLCWPCNNRLGVMENISWMEKAAEYLLVFRKEK